MGKKKASDKLSLGTRIRIKAGVTIPEFPEISCEGWTGRVADLTGKKSEPKYVVEWDDSAIQGMPKSYRDACEEKGLFYRMACFERGDLEAVAG